MKTFRIPVLESSDETDMLSLIADTKVKRSRILLPATSEV
jgi:hypothetical protein